MASPEIIEPVIQKEEGDCAIAALAMYLQKPYREVSELALKVFKQRPHSRGLDLRQIKSLAKRLGTTLESISPVEVDLHEESGILSICKKVPHVVVLFEGVIIDPRDGLLYTVDAYIASSHGRVTRILR